MESIQVTVTLMTVGQRGGQGGACDLLSATLTQPPIWALPSDVLPVPADPQLTTGQWPEATLKVTPVLFYLQIGQGPEGKVGMDPEFAKIRGGLNKGPWARFTTVMD